MKKKNPLQKRFLRELKSQAGKYLAIFLFLVLMVGLVSGFLVTDKNFESIYNRSFTDQVIEDGHLTFRSMLPDSLRQTLEERGDLTLHDLFYFEESIEDTDKTLRIYSWERDVNLPSVLEGKLPEHTGQIALDRMFADNNNLKTGDTIRVKGEDLVISGLVASPDYSCLFEKNTDMMFDSINFSVAFLSQEGFDAFPAGYKNWNYAWVYPKTIPRTDVKAAKEHSDALIQVLKEEITRYDAEVAARAFLTGTLSSFLGMQEKKSEEEPVILTDYLPRYLNQAINFTGDDMSSDAASITVFFWILIVVLAFLFAVIISNTISSEAGAIGTLKASGYTSLELAAHYMLLPMGVSILGAVLGNLLGYTLFSQFFIDIYYGSFSFPKYQVSWNAHAFLMTTVVPLVMLALINFLLLMRKLCLSPLRFLRGDLSRSGRKRAFPLPKAIPFLHRFRARILFQNLPGYLTLFLGIFIGGVLVVFGTMFGPLLNNYKDLVIEERICDYQYVLREAAPTESSQAEPFRLIQLHTAREGYKTDEVSVYEIPAHSAYLDTDLPENGVLLSSALTEKFSLEVGDSVTLRDPFDETKTYPLTVGGIYPYSAGMAVFMGNSDFDALFSGKDSIVSGYFSNERLEDIPEEKIAALITVQDLTKMSNQMTVSMGEMMQLFQYVGVIIFLILMSLLSRQILEKNMASISMAKILGFYDREIARLYLVATSVVVVLSLLVTVPLIDLTLRFLFKGYLYTEINGYLPYLVSNSCYLILFLCGIASYLASSLLQLRKIRRIPMSIALKTVE